MNSSLATIIVLSCVIFYSIFCLQDQNNKLVSILENLNTSVFVSSNEIRHGQCYNEDDLILDIQKDRPKLQQT